MTSTVRLTLAGFAVLLLTGAVAWGQATTAQITGAVKDQSGAVLPGVEVTATHTDTGLTRNAVTDENGSYVLTNLPIGPYRLEAALPGFRTYAQTGIVLQVNSNPVINPVLQVGQVTETVEVQAAAAMVETQTSGVGTVIDNQRVLEMPLNGRNAVELILISGMANTPTGASAGLNGRGFAAYPQIVVSVTGGVGNGVQYLLDGAHHNDTQVALNLPLPFPDALQEFKVEANALPAQYGDHSATVNAVTKSGTNDFHGDAFEFVRNRVFNSRNFFAATRDSLKRNQFGGVIGGPIKHDKLFFFAGYQGTLQRSDPPTSIAYIPTPAMLAGDFTAISSPACNSGRQITLATSQGFVNNQISPARFDPVALKIASLLPTPVDQCGRVTFGLKSNSDEQLAVGKIDYQRGEKHSLFGRFLMADHNSPSTYDGKNPLTSNTVQIQHRVYSLVLADTYLIGSGIVSSFRAGLNRSWDKRTPDELLSWTSLGAQNVTAMAGNLAPLSVTGTGFSVSAGTASKLGLHQGPHTNLAEDISLVNGAHQIGFGVNYFHLMQNYFSYLTAAGTMTVNGQLSGMPLADFLLGSASAWRQGNVAQYHYRQNHIGLYVQDSWKMSSKLRLNYGLRWEPHTAPYSAEDQWMHFDPDLFAQNIHSTVYPNGPAGLIFPGDAQYTVGNHPEKNSWNKFFPRLGVVWDPKGDGLMTIRAAYGMFAERQQLGTAYVTFTQNPPFGNTVNLTNVRLSNPWASYPGGNPFPFVLSKNTQFPLLGSYRNNPFDYKPPYLNQWNLSIQKQFGPDWLVTANYVGNNSIHLVTSTQLNPAVFLGLGPCTLNGPSGPVSYPTCSTTGNTNQRRVLYLQNAQQGQYYSAINAVDDGGTANYHGLLLSVQRRMSRGVSVLANHTWSHCIGDVWDQGLNNPANTPTDRRNNRGNCQTGDQRHVFNLSAVLQAPRLSGGILRALASNWQLSPIFKLRSAQFFTVTTGLDNALNGQASQVPDLVPGVSPYAANKSVDQWLNPAAFTMPAAGTNGNAGRHNLKGPGIFQVDMGLSRTFTIREGKTMQLRAEAFNLPNHMNPSTPVATLNSTGTFGKIQSDISGNSGLSAGYPRIIQFAVKFAF